MRAPEKCAKKFGEEAVETIIAALGSDAAALKSEAADVLYHLLVLLECRGVALGDVLAVLEARMGTIGRRREGVADARPVVKPRKAEPQEAQEA